MAGQLPRQHACPPGLTNHYVGMIWITLANDKELVELDLQAWLINMLNPF